MGLDATPSQSEVIAQVEKECESTITEDACNKQVTIQIPSVSGNVNSLEHIIEEATYAKTIDQFLYSSEAKRFGRFIILVFVIFFLIIGRYSVPDNETKGVEDKLMTALEFANDFINKAGNEVFRDVFQALCSLMVDATFMITFGYWVLKGTSGRLPVTLAIFYVTRALIQKVWYSPFPNGFYWESPGMPSLVVPYGRGSDFFFSGHSGFLVICASEWHKLKFPRVRNFVIFAGVYTVLTLLIYRIHYTIDIFTGLFFAEWCFGKVDSYKDVIDNYWIIGMNKLRTVLNMKPGRIMFIDTDVASFNNVEPTKV